MENAKEQMGPLAVMDGPTYGRTRRSIVLSVLRRYPSMYEYVDDIVSDALLEVARKYFDRSLPHQINIWRLVSINRSVDFMRKRKRLVRISDLSRDIPAY